MVALNSEYFLVCEAFAPPGAAGRWQFNLETVDGTLLLEAGDAEAGDLNRLSLLAVVRGLEALEGPAAVTLLCSSRYVIRGMTESLSRWRDSDFHWEHFGAMLPVTNADLWRRTAAALEIHRVSACCVAAAGPSGGRHPGDRSPRWEGPPASIASRRPAGAPLDRLRRWLLSQSGEVSPSRLAVA